MAFNLTANLNVAVNTGALKAAANQINSTLGSVNNLKIGTNSATFASIRPLKAQIVESTDAIENFGKQAGFAAKRFAAFSVTAGALIGFVQTIKTAIGTAIDFDREMVRLSQVSNDSAQDVASVGQEITRLSTGLGVSSQDLVKVAVTLKQANLSLKDTKIALEAMAQAALAPNFDNLKDTTEGAIAIMNQFKISATGLSGALGAVNVVAGEFAVEAGDIIEAVRKTGGAFKAAGGNLNELIALFTAVRQTTRESAESIGTGLRTIFTRIQRNDTAAALKEVGINLRYTRDEAIALGDAGLTEQFVGPYEAVKRLSEGLNQLRSTDPRFSAIVEQLGGYRQISKVIPLIQEFGTAQKALGIAQAGSVSLALNAGQAQDALAVKLQKLKETFLDVGRNIVNSPGFKSLVDTFITGSTAALRLLDSLKGLIPVLAAIAAVKIGQGLVSFGTGFIKGAAGDGKTNRKADGGFIRMQKGGIVPGSGTGDKVPALLEPGEMVVPKGMVRRQMYATPVNPVTKNSIVPSKATAVATNKNSALIDINDYQKTNQLPQVVQLALYRGKGKLGSEAQRSNESQATYGKYKDSSIPWAIYDAPDLGEDYLDNKKDIRTKIAAKAKKLRENHPINITEGTDLTTNVTNWKALKKTYGKVRATEIVKALKNEENYQLEGYLFEHELKNKGKFKENTKGQKNNFSDEQKAQTAIDFQTTMANLESKIPQLKRDELFPSVKGNTHVLVEAKRSIVSGESILKKEIRQFKSQIDLLESKKTLPLKRFNGGSIYRQRFMEGNEARSKPFPKGLYPEEILGFTKGYIPQGPELTSAFRRAALIHHSDRGGLPENMAQVNAAFQRLKDRNDLKKARSQSGPKTTNTPPPPPKNNAQSEEQMFRSIFGDAPTKDEARSQWKGTNPDTFTKPNRFDSFEAVRNASQFREKEETAKTMNASSAYSDRLRKAKRGFAYGGDVVRQKFAAGKFVAKNSSGKFVQGNVKGNTVEEMIALLENKGYTEVVAEIIKSKTQIEKQKNKKTISEEEKASIKAFGGVGSLLGLYGGAIAGGIVGLPIAGAMVGGALGGIGGAIFGKNVAIKEIAEREKKELEIKNGIRDKYGRIIKKDNNIPEKTGRSWGEFFDENKEKIFKRGGAGFGSIVGGIAGSPAGPLGVGAGAMLGAGIGSLVSPIANYFNGDSSNNKNKKGSESIFSKANDYLNPFSLSTLGLDSEEGKKFKKYTGVGSMIGGVSGGILGSMVGAPLLGAGIGSGVGGMLGSLTGAYKIDTERAKERRKRRKSEEKESEKTKNYTGDIYQPLPALELDPTLGKSTLFTKEMFAERKKNRGFASGGLVPGTGNSDTVPMDLDEGSFVIKKSSTNKIGAQNLANAHRFESGGKVPSLLTPGEYVYTPSEAKKIGATRLNQMNSYGQLKKLAAGGPPGKKPPLISDVYLSNNDNIDKLTKALIKQIMSRDPSKTQATAETEAKNTVNDIKIQNQIYNKSVGDIANADKDISAEKSNIGLFNADLKGLRGTLSQLGKEATTLGKSLSKNAQEATNLSDAETALTAKIAQAEAERTAKKAAGPDLTQENKKVDSAQKKLDDLRLKRIDMQEARQAKIDAADQKLAAAEEAKRLKSQQPVDITSENKKVASAKQTVDDLNEKKIGMEKARQAKEDAATQKLAMAEQAKRTKEAQPVDLTRETKQLGNINGRIAILEERRRAKAGDVRAAATMSMLPGSPKPTDVIDAQIAEAKRQRDVLTNQMGNKKPDTKKEQKEIDKAKAQLAESKKPIDSTDIDKKITRANDALKAAENARDIKKASGQDTKKEDAAIEKAKTQKAEAEKPLKSRVIDTKITRADDALKAAEAARANKKVDTSKEDAQLLKLNAQLAELEQKKIKNAQDKVSIENSITRNSTQTQRVEAAILQTDNEILAAKQRIATAEAAKAAAKATGDKAASSFMRDAKGRVVDENGRVIGKKTSDAGTLKESIREEQRRTGATGKDAKALVAQKMIEDYQEKAFNQQRGLAKAQGVEFDPELARAKAADLARSSSRGRATVEKDASGKIIGDAGLGNQLGAMNKDRGGQLGFFSRIGERFGLGGPKIKLNEQEKLQRSAERRQNIAFYGQAAAGTGAAVGSYFASGMKESAGSAEGVFKNGPLGASPTENDARSANFKDTYARAGMLEKSTSYGAAGAAAGAMFGPLGVAVGGLVGVVVGASKGYADGLKEAEAQIREVKIAKAAENLQGIFDRVGNGLQEFDASIAESIRANQKVLNEEGGKKAFDTSGGNRDFIDRIFKGGINLNELQTQLEKGSKQNSAQQLVPLTNLINKQAENAGKQAFDAQAKGGANVAGLNFNDLKDGIKKNFLEANAGFNKDAIAQIASAKNITFEAAEREFIKVIQDSFKSAQLKKTQELSIKSNQTAINSMEMLASAVNAAALASEVFTDKMRTNASLFEGSISGTTISSLSNQLNNKSTPDLSAYNKALNQIATSLGTYGEEFKAQGSALNVASQELPSILANIVENPISGNDPSSQIADALTKALAAKGIKGEAASRVVNSVSGGVAGQDYTKFLAESGGNVEKAAEKLLENLKGPFLQTSKDIADKLQNASNGYIQGLVELANRQKQVRQSFELIDSKKLQRDKFESEQKAKAVGLPSQASEFVSYDRMTQGFKNKQTRLTENVVGNVEDPREIYKRLQKVQEQIKPQEEKVQNASLSEKGGETFRNAANELLKLKSEASNLNEALKNLSDQSERLSAAQEKLAKIQRDRETELSVGKRLLTGGPEARQRFGQGQQLLNVAQKQGFNIGNFNDEQAKILFEFVDQFGEKGKDISDQIVKSTTGLGVGTKGKQKEEAALTNEITRIMNAQVEAQQLLTANQKTLQQEYFATLNEQNTTFYSKLDGFIAAMQEQQRKASMGVAQQNVARIKSVQQGSSFLRESGVNDSNLKFVNSNKQLVSDLIDQNKQDEQSKNVTQNLDSDMFGTLFDKIAGNIQIGGPTDQVTTGKTYSNEFSVIKENLSKLGVVNEQQKSQIMSTLLKTLSESEKGADVKQILKDSISSGMADALGSNRASLNQRLEKTGNAQLFNDIANNAKVNNVGFDQIDKALTSVMELGKGIGQDLTSELINAENALAQFNPQLQNLTAVASGFMGQLTGFNPAALLPPKPGAGPVANAPKPAGMWASGGAIFSPKGTDTVPAMLTPGEFVVNKSATQQNLPLLQSINSGKTSYLSKGGPVLYAAGGAGPVIEDDATALEKRYLNYLSIYKSDPKNDNQTSKEIYWEDNRSSPPNFITDLEKSIKDLVINKKSKFKDDENLDRAYTDVGIQYLNSFKDKEFQGDDVKTGKFLKNVSVDDFGAANFGIKKIRLLKNNKENEDLKNQVRELQNFMGPKVNKIYGPEISDDYLDTYSMDVNTPSRSTSRKNVLTDSYKDIFGPLANGLQYLEGGYNVGAGTEGEKKLFADLNEKIEKEKKKIVDYFEKDPAFIKGGLIGGTKYQQIQESYFDTITKSNIKEKYERKLNAGGYTNLDEFLPPILRNSFSNPDFKPRIPPDGFGKEKMFDGIEYAKFMDRKVNFLNYENLKDAQDVKFNDSISFTGAEQNKKNNDAKIAELIKEYEVEAYKIRDELNKKLKDKQDIQNQVNLIPKAQQENAGGGLPNLLAGLSNDALQAKLNEAKNPIEKRKIKFQIAMNKRSMSGGYLGGTNLISSDQFEEGEKQKLNYNNNNMLKDLKNADYGKTIKMEDDALQARRGDPNRLAEIYLRRQKQASTIVGGLINPNLREFGGNEEQNNNKINSATELGNTFFEKYDKDPGATTDVPENKLKFVQGQQLAIIQSYIENKEFNKTSALKGPDFLSLVSSLSTIVPGKEDEKDPPRKLIGFEDYLKAKLKAEDSPETFAGSKLIIEARAKGRYKALMFQSAELGKAGGQLSFKQLEDKVNKDQNFNIIDRLAKNQKPKSSKFLMRVKDALIDETERTAFIKPNGKEDFVASFDESAFFGMGYPNTNPPLDEASDKFTLDQLKKIATVDNKNATQGSGYGALTFAANKPLPIGIGFDDDRRSLIDSSKVRSKFGEQGGSVIIESEPYKEQIRENEFKWKYNRKIKSMVWENAQTIAKSKGIAVAPAVPAGEGNAMGGQANPNAGNGNLADVELDPSFKALLGDQSGKQLKQTTDAFRNKRVKPIVDQKIGGESEYLKAYSENETTKQIRQDPLYVSKFPEKVIANPNRKPNIVETGRINPDGTPEMIEGFLPQLDIKPNTIEDKDLFYLRNNNDDSSYIDSTKSPEYTFTQVFPNDDFKERFFPINFDPKVNGDDLIKYEINRNNQIRKVSNLTVPYGSIFDEEREKSVNKLKNDEIVKKIEERAQESLDSMNRSYAIYKKLYKNQLEENIIEDKYFKAQQPDKLKVEEEPAPQAKAKGGMINYLANGGVPSYAPNPDPSYFKPMGTDTVPAMLTPGEFVVNASATAKHGDLLSAINSGQDVSALALGGKVNYLAYGGRAKSTVLENARSAGVEGAGQDSNFAMSWGDVAMSGFNQNYMQEKNMAGAFYQNSGLGALAETGFGADAAKSINIAQSDLTGANSAASSGVSSVYDAIKQGGGPGDAFGDLSYSNVGFKSSVYQAKIANENMKAFDENLKELKKQQEEWDALPEEEKQKILAKQNVDEILSNAARNSLNVGQYKDQGYGAQLKLMRQRDKIWGTTNYNKYENMQLSSAMADANRNALNVGQYQRYGRGPVDAVYGKQRAHLKKGAGPYEKAKYARFSKGGIAHLQSGGNVDNQPAMLSEGEFVVNKDSAKKHSGLLNYINKGKEVKKYSKGGGVGVSYLQGGGPAEAQSGSPTQVDGTAIKNAAMTIYAASEKIINASIKSLEAGRQMIVGGISNAQSASKFLSSSASNLNSSQQMSQSSVDFGSYSQSLGATLSGFGENISGFSESLDGFISGITDEFSKLDSTLRNNFGNFSSSIASFAISVDQLVTSISGMTVKHEHKHKWDNELNVNVLLDDNGIINSSKLKQLVLDLIAGEQNTGL